MSMASVLIVEDDRFTRTTLVHALIGLNVNVVAECGRPQDAINIDEEYDVALLDLDLGPGANGIDLAYGLRKKNPQLGIVILTSYSDPRVADPKNRALPKGTIFLTKSKITDMSSVISAILTAKKTPLNAGRKGASLIALSDKQIEVLVLLSKGFTTAEIARNQGVGEKAIEATITKLHHLLELPKSSTLNTRVQLVRAYFNLRGIK